MSVPHYAEEALFRKNQAAMLPNDAESPQFPSENFSSLPSFWKVGLNRIAQLMAGDGAAEINYHGMRPSNVDGLEAEACRADPRPTGQEVAR